MVKFYVIPILIIKNKNTNEFFWIEINPKQDFRSQLPKTNNKEGTRIKISIKRR